MTATRSEAGLLIAERALQAAQSAPATSQPWTCCSTTASRSHRPRRGAAHQERRPGRPPPLGLSVVQTEFDERTSRSSSLAAPGSRSSQRPSPACSADTLSARLPLHPDLDTWRRGRLAKSWQPTLQQQCRTPAFDYHAQHSAASRPPKAGSALGRTASSVQRPSTGHRPRREEFARNRHIPIAGPHAPSDGARAPLPTERSVRTSARARSQRA